MLVACEVHSPKASWFCSMKPLIFLSMESIPSDLNSGLLFNNLRIGGHSKETALSKPNTAQRVASRRTPILRVLFDNDNGHSSFQFGQDGKGHTWLKHSCTKVSMLQYAQNVAHLNTLVSFVITTASFPLLCLVCIDLCAERFGARNMVLATGLKILYISRTLCDMFKCQDLYAIICRHTLQASRGFSSRCMSFSDLSELRQEISSDLPAGKKTNVLAMRGWRVVVTSTLYLLTSRATLGQC